MDRPEDTRLMAMHFVKKWSAGNSDLFLPSEILAAQRAGVQISFPQHVTDLSGQLHRLSPGSQHRIQKPRFNVAQGTQQLACTCKSCSQPSFPPVCTNCTCQEAEGHPEVYSFGKQQPILSPTNAMKDWPSCKQWACFNKEGWFCSCTCPGEACPEPRGWF